MLLMSDDQLKHILIIDDDPEFLRLAQWMLQESGYLVSTAKDHDQAIGRIREAEPDAVLLDRQLEEEDGLDLIAPIQGLLPSVPIILITANSTYELAVQAVKVGAYDFLTKPLDEARLFSILNNAIERGRLLKQVGPEPDDEQGFEGIIGQSPAMRAVFGMISNVAPTESSVLIRGESGTGKELIAAAIHSRSKKNDGPFVPINMATLPSELVESTLFGHEKGSFTGADKQRVGACEEAQGGTLFLDEITEMPIDLQPKLLRFLQEKTFRRVGGTKDITSDARIVSATNRDPLQAIRDNRLREDLYYRLNVIPIDLPALRERAGDIALLASFAMHRVAAMNGKAFTKLSASCIEKLSKYAWPGNVRQLLHTIERAVIMNDGNALDAEMVLIDDAEQPAVPSPPAVNEPEVHAQAEEMTGQPPFSGDLIIPLSELERMAITHAIRTCNGSPGVAAKKLGISPATIYRKIKAYDISFEE